MVFQAQDRINYMVHASSTLTDWSHLVTVRGEGELTWILPPAQTSYQQRFFRVAPVVARGVDELTSWAAYMASGAGDFRIGLIGDSYTHHPTRYVRRLRDNLAVVHGDLAAGCCCFGFKPTFRKNGSIDAGQLDFSLNPNDWTATYGDGYGPDACHVVSNSAGASITVAVGADTNTLRIHYVSTVGSSGFRYNVDGGGWNTQPTDGTLAYASTDVDVSAETAPFDLTLEALSAGVTLLAAEAINTGDGIVAHKLGASGRLADNFMTNQIARDATRALDLDMVIVMFGTNEQASNRTPASFGAAIENIIQTLRDDNPAIDVVLILPPYTMLEEEAPTHYSLDAYGEELERIAGLSMACTVKLTEVFGPASELQNLIDDGLMSTDRIHPTKGSGSGGYLIADTIGDLVFSLYE